jgi:hypothetical protein
MTKQSSMSTLSSVMENFLSHVDNAICITLSALDGIELMSVCKDGTKESCISPSDNQTIQSLIQSFSTSMEQSAKLGIGNVQYSMTWTDTGILVQHKVNAMLISIFMNSDSNLGLIEYHLSTITRIVSPFSSDYFISQIV